MITYHHDIIQGTDEWQKHGGMLFVCHTNGRSKDNRKISLWVCGECGNLKKYPHKRVLSGAKKSCGCLRIKKGIPKSHGMKYSPEYRVWQAIKNRCLNVRDKDYPRYGGSGIGMHEEWKYNFLSFYNHIGPRPDGRSVDRIDNTKGYFPGNVRWASADQQSINRRNSYYWHIKGITFDSLRKASEFYGVSQQTIYRWTVGSFDKRRGRFTQSRPDCSRSRKYNND